jgi:creatinine amidohydrolase
MDDKEYRWEINAWPEIEQRLQSCDTALLPCGAIEQHGPHLPLDVDHFDAVHLAHQVAMRCSNPKPIVVPGIPYGVSYHHQDFKGTLSVTNESLSRFVYDIGLSLAHNGIRKIVIINGHGDNLPTLSFAAQMINRDAHIFVCVDTGETSGKEVSKLAQTYNDIHAGEIETSTTLALRPELVDMDKAVNETIQFDTSFLDFGFSHSVPWYVRTKKISASGVLGNATAATREKGELIWAVMTQRLVELVEGIKDKDIEELFQKRY